MKWICNLKNRTPIKWSSFFCFSLSQLLILGGTLKGDVTLPEGLGPVATPINVNVNRGEELTIKLTASMKGSGGVFDFSIFEKPKSGQLVVESLTGSFALVKYLSDPFSPSGLDQFKYRARVRGGKYSAPAMVRINVINDPLRLKLPKVLNFGEVAVNQSREIDFQVLNTSKYEFNGSLVLPGEFSLEKKDNNISLGPNQSVSIKIKFTPKEVIGSFQRKLLFNGDGVSLELPVRGISVSPLKLRDKKIILAYSEESFSRSAELSIENVTDAEVSLEVVDIEGAFVASPQKMIFDSKGIRKIIIEATNEDASKGKGSIQLRSPVDIQKIEVESPPLPPRVILNGGENIIKISPVQGVPFKFEFGIENVGGGSVSVALSVPEGFRRTNGDGDIYLGPKSKRLLQLEYDSKKEGAIYDYFSVRWGNNSKRIIIKGDVLVDLKPETNNKPRVRPSTIAERGIPKVKGYDLPLLKRVEKEREFDNSLPQITEVKLIERGKRSLVLGWSVTSTGTESFDDSDLGYVIETRVHRYDKEMQSMVLEWRELGPDYAIIQKNDSSVEAKINGLSPNGKFTFRIFSKSNEGLVSVGSAPFQFQTKSSFKFTKANWLYLMGIGGAVLCLVCILIQRKTILNT